MGYTKYKCPVRARCGGCEWLDVPYPWQLARKRDALEQCFSQLGAGVERMVGMDDPTRYRAKIASPFAPGPRGACLHGMYARGTHELVAVESCLVEYDAGRPILATIARLCRTFRIAPYNEDTGAGLLRHAIVRVAHASGQVMVTLVVNRKEFPHKKAFVAALRDEHPAIATVVFNVNTRNTNAILGPHYMTAWGQGWIEDELCGCTFRIPAGAFYQTNPVQTEALYNEAVSLADLQAGDVLYDAYCGIGTIGIVAARATRCALIGVESTQAAVGIAADNARLNRIADARFVLEDAAEPLRSAEVLPDVVIMDPPRAGASPAFLEALLAAAPRRIVYVSCNPATQVRDIEALGAAYALEHVVGVDMFPHTSHIESVASLAHV